MNNNKKTVVTKSKFQTLLTHGQVNHFDDFMFYCTECNKLETLSEDNSKTFLCTSCYETEQNKEDEDSAEFREWFNNR